MYYVLTRTIVCLPQRSGVVWQQWKKTKLQAHGSNPVCLLTRCKAPQQSISDYKHGARACVSAAREERRKNRARGRRTAEEREKVEAAGVGEGENEEAD